MSFAFIHPPISALASGGNIYNGHILQQALLHRFDLHSIESQQITAQQIVSLGKVHRLLIWDSLFWEQLAPLSAQLKTSRSCLLCHYLPSLNPQFTKPQRLRWETTEHQVLAAMGFIIVTGPSLRDEIKRRFPGAGVTMCEPGVDPVFTAAAAHFAASSATTRLLTVANLLPEKGYMDILFALADLSDRAWHWHICGNGDVNPCMSAQFWRAVTNYQLTAKITYHGVLTPLQLARLMRTVDIFVTASYYESYGMALAEAAAMKLAIISTDTGIARQIVTHGINGFLLQPGDQRALYDYLAVLIEHAPLQMAFRTRQHFQRRSWRQCFETFRSLCIKAVATDA